MKLFSVTYLAIVLSWASPGKWWVIHETTEAKCEKQVEELTAYIKAGKNEVCQPVGDKQKIKPWMVPAIKKMNVQWSAS